MAVPTPSGTGRLAFSVRPPAPVPRASCAARARASAGAGAGANWWAPLLGWSGQPDYIDAAARPESAEEAEAARPPPRGHAPRGVLTEDKARQLRVRMMESASFHDAMYHSAIASRLASAAPDSKR